MTRENLDDGGPFRPNVEAWLKAESKDKHDHGIAGIAKAYHAKRRAKK